MLHHSNGSCSFKNSTFFPINCSLTVTLYIYNFLLSFVPLFCHLTLFSVKLEVLVNYKNGEVGLLEYVDLPLLHRHAQEGNKSHYSW